MATKTITVVSTSEIKSGDNNGRPWTLYEVVATDVNGEPIEQKLKSFDYLQGTVEVEVEVQKHEKYGTSYMLTAAGKRKGGGQGGLGKSVDELRQRLDRLEERIAQLERGPTSVATTPAPATDDIPF